ncbi:hypothetical protein ACRALDRAFT_206554 [Sodiomyces alcalophilus JCM 7366]|uniref:uncharacterized protein n=1 Tax=Sodiomyces alcalophilus JCM 7366 TaxID=591952 RepID=UPI0039B61279
MEMVLWNPGGSAEEERPNNLGLIRGVRGEPRLTWVDRAVLALPGRPVRQIVSMRDSYVNAWLIQSRGAGVREPCTPCRRKMSRDVMGYAYPFPVCFYLPGHFGGCCGNCKWPDGAAKGGNARGLPAPGYSP